MQDPRLPEPDVAQRDSADGFDVRAILQVLLRHRWAILGLTALVTLLAALFVHRQIPIYQAQATLLIERTPPRFAPIQDPYLAYTEYYRYYETQYGLIKRRAIGERVVEALGLVEQAAPVEDAEDEGFHWKDLFPEDWFPEPPPPDPEARYERLVSGVVGAIEVQPRQNSQLVDLAVAHPDPEMAARLANAVARAFIQDNLEGRLEMSEQAASFLTERMAELREQLEESEEALNAFLEQEDLLDVSGIDGLATQELGLVSSKLQTLQRQRAEVESVYRQIQDAGEAGARELDTIPGLIDYPQVQRAGEVLTEAERRMSELSARYGPLHPKMIAANNELESARASFDRQLATVMDVIAKRYEAARAAEREAEAEFEAVKQELREIDRKEFTLQALKREVATNRELFERFQTQFKETDAAGGVEAANARIIEPARVPGAPIRPNKRRTILLGALLGLALAIGAAFLLEHLDNTLKDAEEAERRLELPVIGMLPQLSRGSRGDLAPLREFDTAPKSAFAEAVRTIRTGVLLSALDARLPVILVTSSVPGEGKTTLSMNLARALSEMKSVLLIDADLRRPMVAKALGEPQARGLSHFIAGEAPLDECIHPLTSSLHVMPAGIAPPNPLELLSSARFASALENLAERYDHVVLDCAPALAVSDAMVLSRLASSVVYVVCADATPTQAAQAGLKRLRRAGAHVVGAVLNRMERRARLGYGRYAGYQGDSYYSNYGYVSDERRAARG